MAYLGRLFGFIRPYRGLSIASLVFLAVLVCFDLAIPRLIQRIIDHGILEHDRGVVLWTAVLMLGISAVSTVIAIGNNVYSVRVGEGVARDLREALFLKIQSYSFGNLDRQKTGQLMVRLTSDVSAIKSLTQISLRIGTRAPLLMLGSLVLMVATSAELALTMLPLLVVTSALIVVFIMKMEPLFRVVQSKLDTLNNVLQENIAGARLVKSLVRADFEEERFAVANEEMTDRSIEVMKFTSAMMPALTLCVNVGMVVVIWSGGLEAIRGRLSVGQIVAFSNYMLTTMTPIVMMTMLSNTWAAGLASARRVHDILSTVSDVVDTPGATALPGDAKACVALDGVSFTYHGEGNEAVLEDIELRAEPGQTVAILGATGAGKSTLVNLVPRFYDVTSGTVSFADHDVRRLTQDSLIAQIGVVPQEALLFTGTIRDNIAYGRPGASDEEVVRAAKTAEAHDFVAKLPAGYDTHVEERGANFSGGQKQRLAIARALLLRPKLLLLDDSTSAVDVETETRIQDALEKDKDERTTIVVAQRISTVLKADRIYVLDKGRVVAAGTHHELMRASAIYQEIYESQLGRGVAVEPVAQESEVAQ
ncbi:MAG TPA: ABC transporter ATP-binding protein [Polyangiaceae bacterium]|nr:ABC transporter ATP-binding protein [Polyangiaceae bacterium]